MTWIGERPSERGDNQICPLRDRCTAPRRARVRAVESHQIASHCYGVVPPPEHKDSSRGFRKGASATAVRPESITLKTAVPPLLAFGVPETGSRASEPSGPGGPSAPRAGGREGSHLKFEPQAPSVEARTHRRLRHPLMIPTPRASVGHPCRSLTQGNAVRPPTSRILCNIGLAPRVRFVSAVIRGFAADKDREGGCHALDDRRDSVGAVGGRPGLGVYSRRVGPSPAGHRRYCRRVPVHWWPPSGLTAPR
jgi:hypothetical protein